LRAGSDDLLNFSPGAYLADGDEAIPTTHGFLVLPDRDARERAKRVVDETNYRPMGRDSSLL